MRRRLKNERAFKQALCALAAVGFLASCGKKQKAAADGDDSSVEASANRDAAEATKVSPERRQRPGPPGSIVPGTPGPPWPAAGITLASKDGTTTRQLSVKQGEAIGAAIETHLRSEKLPSKIATNHAARLRDLTSTPPMADEPHAPRVGQFLLRFGEFNTLEGVATLEIRAHHRVDLVLEIKESANDFTVGRARTEMSDGSGN